MDTTALRVLAVFLIANSHLEDLYPFRPLAADGLIGNALFFMLSGLGLSLSARTKSERFGSWYGRRLKRIYPALWISVLAGSVLMHAQWKTWGGLDYLMNLVWPTPYGFITQIVLYYVAFYWLKAARSRRLEWGVVLALAIAYLGVAVFRYNLHVLSWIFCFAIMVLGGLMADNLGNMGRHPRRDLASLCMLMFVYVGLKLAMVTGRLTPNTAYLHLLTLGIVRVLLGLNATPAVQSWMHRPRLSPPLKIIGGMTLEIYLIHGFVYETPAIARLPFPVNILAFWLVTLPLAWIVSALAGRSIALVERLPKISRTPQISDATQATPRPRFAGKA